MKKNLTGRSVSKLVGRPRKITDVIRERKISWLELFYDLVFTVVLARLTDGLVDELTGETLRNATILFAWFFWSWHETSGYFDNHGNDSILNVLIINAQMIIAGITAIFIPEAIQGNFSHIRWGMIAMTGMLIFIWRLIAHFDPIHRPASQIWARVYTVSLMGLLVAVVVPPILTFWLIVISLAANMGVVFFARHALQREYQQTGMHFRLKDSLIERYGLMTMIALGEIIAGLFAPLHLPLAPAALGSFIASSILVALISAVYYQVMGAIHVVLNSPVQVMAVRWLYLLDIYGVMMIGVLLSVAIMRDRLSWRLIFIAVLFLTLWLMWLIQRIAQRKPTETHSGRVMIVELLLMFLMALLPVDWLIVGLDLILAGVLTHYLYNRGQLWPKR